MTELGVYEDGVEVEVEDERATEAKLREYGIMFSELMKSDRFKELVGIYFTFTKFVNEESREIEFKVIENPPEVIAKKMQGKTVEAAKEIEIVSGSKAQAVLEQAKKGFDTQGGRRYKDPKRR